MKRSITDTRSDEIAVTAQVPPVLTMEGWTVQHELIEMKGSPAVRAS